MNRANSLSRAGRAEASTIISPLEGYPMNISSLSAFKQFLRTPGATMTLVRHDNIPPGHRNYNLLFTPRAVTAVRATEVGLAVSGHSEPSWLKLSPASAFRFDGDLVTVDLGRGDFSKVMSYRVSTEGEHVEDRTGSGA